MGPTVWRMRSTRSSSRPREGDSCWILLKWEDWNSVPRGQSSFSKGTPGCSADIFRNSHHLVAEHNSRTRPWMTTARRSPITGHGRPTRSTSSTADHPSTPPPLAIPSLSTFPGRLSTSLGIRSTIMELSRSMWMSNP